MARILLRPTLIVSYPGKVLRLMLYTVSKLTLFRARRLIRTDAFRWSPILKQIMKGLQERNISRNIDAQGIDRFALNDGGMLANMAHVDLKMVCRQGDMATYT